MVELTERDWQRCVRERAKLLRSTGMHRALAVVVAERLIAQAREAHSRLLCTAQGGLPKTHPVWNTKRSS